MGWDEAKTRRPTEAELQEMVRLIHEAMDHGACGWSAQVLGETSVQRDYDGTPMITDLLSEHEVLTFAQVLRDRDEGFIELAYQETGEDGRPLAKRPATSSSRLPRFRDARCSTRPSPPTPSTGAAPRADPLAGELRRAWPARLRPGRYPPRRLRADLRGLEPVRRYASLARRHPGRQATRKAKMSDPAMRQALKDEWDSGTRPTLVVQGSVGSLQVMTRKVRLTSAQSPTSPGCPPRSTWRGRLLPGQHPRRLQAAVRRLPAPGRHHRRRGRRLRLRHPRLRVRAETAVASPP